VRNTNRKMLNVKQFLDLGKPWTVSITQGDDFRITMSCKREVLRFYFGDD